jgi:hypothetical protein
MEKDKLIEQMLKEKGDANNSIDLDAYARGLIDMYDKLANISGQSELLLTFAKYVMPNNYTSVALNNIVKTFLEERKHD